jgi:hypothetical protein
MTSAKSDPTISIEIRTEIAAAEAAYYGWPQE